MHEIRSGDAVYRSGPKTFVVLLPEQALDTANLAAAAAAARGRELGRARDTAVSVGIVTTAGATPEPAALLELAEAARARSEQTGGVEDSQSGGRGARHCG